MLTQTELLSQRSKRSRGRGRDFETRVKQRLEKWGFRAKKVVLSGATKKKPYDIIVSPFRLKIEAKRRMGEGIIIESKWLKKIAPKYIVVFAAGPRLSKAVRMCVISQAATVRGMTEILIEGQSKRLGVLDDKFFVRRKGREDVVTGTPFVLVHNKKRYLVEDFEFYMMKNWRMSLDSVTLASAPKENKDVGTT
jgi:Holliday junction resolvase